MNQKSWVLAITTFLIAAGGLLYEIYLGAFGSYLFGDSVKVFSLTTGLYMFSMGIGAFSVKPDATRVEARLLWTELALMVLHVGSPFAIWSLFVIGSGTNVLFWAVLLCSGLLVGTEIPLVLALARKSEGSSDARIHQILAADYLGALVASLAFGFYLLPHAGLIGSAAFAALAEGLGALVLAIYLARQTPSLRKFLNSMALGVAVLAIASAYVLVRGPVLQQQLENAWVQTLVNEASLTHSEWTGFSNVSLYTYTDPRNGHHEEGLLLDRQQQWSTGPELFYYHELLTVPASESFRRVTGHLPDKILIIGGGDGFAVERLHTLYKPSSITLVDIDRRISELARSVPFWRDAGGWALNDPSVHIHNEDAFSFVLRNKSHERYDLVVIDLPDPRHPALARFFTPLFFAALSRLMSPNGHLTIQASSAPQRPLGRVSYVCSLQQSLQEVGFKTSVLVGDEYDYYVTGTRSHFAFPERGEKLSGRYMTNGDRVQAHLTDSFGWFDTATEKHCAHVARNTLLAPTLLDL